jgi:hypothetical protein
MPPDKLFQQALLRSLLDAFAFRVFICDSNLRVAWGICVCVCLSWGHIFIADWRLLLANAVAAD